MCCTSQRLDYWNVGFLGPNGAGKTTTMRMMICFLPPSSGAATVAGFDVLEQPLEIAPSFLCRSIMRWNMLTASFCRSVQCFIFATFIGAISTISGAQSQPASRITQPIDNRVRVTLKGNVHPLVQARYDRGPVADSFPADRSFCCCSGPRIARPRCCSSCRRRTGREVPAFIAG